MHKRISLFVGLAALIGIFVAIYLYNKPHRDIQTEEAIFTGEISLFKSELANGTAAFDSLYMDKVVDLTGDITAVGETNLTLDHVVICSMDSTVEMTQFQRGNLIRVKARVVGAEEDLIEGLIIRLDKAQSIQ